ncbi:thiamine-phosphate kinase [Halomonas vilamensis]|uniref:Thiamine-monophosphate kinase n=1 Tax=Vreelandella vilamensis TaxID=531309 RepID=A0ABU1H7T0_9GAMM|nr:thiamine-phosphate kinase [Halomonas vilamensis]MDR5899578.1 thiamine-phosphate kinase [Halomonas vilamensis]
MLGEFELIQRYFTSSTQGHGVALGVGDDATLLTPTAGQQLVVSVDTSVVNVHFPSDAPAKAIGHRALAVALSDLAAMGATSRWCLMALTLDQQSLGGHKLDDDQAVSVWLQAYAQGFLTLCEQHETTLVGGDVTLGNLSIGVTVMGEVPSGGALTRRGAQAGDIIAVTGALGGGGGGLALWQQGERDLAHPLIARYLLPMPRLAAGRALRGLASSALDISDGLIADLGHLRQASGVGATLEVDAIPLAEGLVDSLGPQRALKAALSGGDDYELLVTIPQAHWAQAAAALKPLGIALTAIGRCEEEPGVRGVPPEGETGWQHFVEQTPSGSDPSGNRRGESP